MFLNGAGKESYLCFKESVPGESRMRGKQCRRRRVSEGAALVIQVTDVKGQSRSHRGNEDKWDQRQFIGHVVGGAIGHW